MNQPAIVDFFEPLGLPVEVGTPDELGTVLRSEADKWREIVEKANIKLQ
jgi:hypothetical protein